MRFKDVFSIIGPAMIGPSSSHTAGAVRIGRVARQLLGELPEQVKIGLYGSFAETYRGHGTDVALVGGILGMDTDDPGIRESLEEAERRGVDIAIAPSRGIHPHPNTARVVLRKGKRHADVLGSSIGGGNIVIHAVNGFDIRFSGAFPTVVLFHRDKTGVIANVTKVLSDAGINIGFMDVARIEREGEAMTVIEVDSPVSNHVLEQLMELPHIHRVLQIDLAGKERDLS